jgi:hypothetical protein
MPFFGKVQKPIKSIILFVRMEQLMLSLKYKIDLSFVNR